MTTPPTPPQDRSWIILVVGLVLAGVGYLLFFANDRQAADRPQPTGPVADYAWKLQALDGRTVPFSEYRGKTVFLNIWATWCKPCISEMPSIAALASRPELKDVVFLCVSAGEDPEVVRQFIADKKWPMRVLVAADAPAVFLTDGVPATFIIAADGRVVGSVVGAEDWDQPKFATLLAAQLKAAPGEQAPAPPPRAATPPATP